MRVNTCVSVTGEVDIPGSWPPTSVCGRQPPVSSGPTLDAPALTHSRQFVSAQVSQEINFFLLVLPMFCNIFLCWTANDHHSLKAKDIIWQDHRSFSFYFFVCPCDVCLCVCQRSVGHSFVLIRPCWFQKCNQIFFCMLNSYSFFLSLNLPGCTGKLRWRKPPLDKCSSLKWSTAK